MRYVDAIGLACPLAAACAARTGKGEYWNLAVKQVEEYDMALLPGSSFPAHGFEMERGYPLGLYDWSRGLGWYALGLCELYRLMARHGRPEAAGMARRILALAEELLPLQKKNGGFGWMVARPESVFESSGTALLGLLLLAAYRISGGGDAPQRRAGHVPGGYQGHRHVFRRVEPDAVRPGNGPAAERGTQRGGG